MKQKTRIASKLFAALVVLTLISCCFLGTTMARYTSAGTGTAKVEVAKWDIEFTGGIATDENTFSFGKLSPDMEEYDGSTARTHSTNPELIVSITNNSEVSAKVKVSQAATYFGFQGNAGTYNDALDEIFTISYYTAYTSETENTPYTLGTEVTLTTGQKLDIYAVVTWNSDVGGVTGDAADARDTVIGENITSVNWSLVYSAVQASERPTT